jgi:hypothetical protein
MNAIKIDTTIDEAIAQALPALRPLLGARVELIALQAEAAEPQRGRLTMEEFRASRLQRPEGVAPVTLEDMERALAGGVPVEEPGKGDAHDFWLYLMSMPSGCEDADFERPLDKGRPEVEWE